MFVTNPSPQVQNESIPQDLLEPLAEQARGLRLCVVLLADDGSFAFQDPQPAAFFDRYVLPLLRTGVLKDAPATNSAWEVLPGVLAYAAPVVRHRRSRGTLVVLGRTAEFSLNEEVLGHCNRMGIDSAWLAAQAGSLTGQNASQLAAVGTVLHGALADRVAARAAQDEIDSLSSQLANTYEELSLIERISGGMKVNRSSADFFREACVDVMQVINARGMGVLLESDKCRQEPALFGQVALAGSDLRRLADQLMDVLRQRKCALLINDLAADPQWRWLSGHASRLLAQPLQRQEQVLGAVFALDKAAGDFDSVDIKLLGSISNESAIYLENAILFGDVHGLMMGLLHSLTSAVDAKDAYTCGHSERVALLSRHLAVRVELSDAQVERVYMAGLLHDVGKIGVPESVLQKTGRLTPEEFEQMKKHPEIGARILADVKQLEDIIPGVLHHHERFDGRGYPRGLSGHEIPLMGRIICLADCFDAMTSNRTYRKALPLEVALCEIRRCAGTQFDPELAEGFLKIKPDEFRALLRDHQQQARRLLELQQTLRAA